MQAQELQSEGVLVLPHTMELRGPTHDEAVMLRLQQPVFALTAPVGEDDRTRKQQRSDAEKAKDKEETARIQAELADALNAEGVCAL